MVRANEQDLERWVRDQLKARNIDFVDLIDTQAWPRGPQPNLYVILGIGERANKEVNQWGLYTFPFVMLAQSSSAQELKDAKRLAIWVPGETDDGEIPSVPADAEDPFNRPFSIDPTSIQIRNGEYAFGVRYRVGNVGNKGGHAYEVLGLFRYHDSILTEIFRDVVWAYSKYEEGSDSCNSEMVIVPAAPETGRPSEFFTLTRKHKRSYLGETHNPQFAGFKPSKEIPVQSCRPFRDLEKPNAHKWNSREGIYLDQRGKYLDPSTLN